MSLDNFGVAERIHKLIAQYRVRPNHLRGQNFLVDDAVYARIIEAASLTKKDLVLEVGPGLGTLTDKLAEFAKQVIAVEVDKKFVAILKHRFAQAKNVSIVLGDILKAPVKEFGVTQDYKVVANIPYYLTGKLLRKFMTQDKQPSMLVLLLQKEVAGRLTAKPGEMSLLALSVQLYAEVSIVSAVPRTAFWPVPAVDSALVQISEVHPFPYADVSEKFFWRILRVGFASPRKQLHNNIIAGFSLSQEESRKILVDSGIPERARAQDLSISSWHALARILQEGSRETS